MNILYGVPGEGMGHATRSKVIIDYLLGKGHEVSIVASSRAFHFLDKSFPGKVVEIKGFHFAFKNAQVSKTGTFMLNLRSSGANLLHNFKKKLLIEKSFSPDIVISDFESFAFFFAKLHKLPIISIDNMQVMDRCVLDIEIPKEEKNNYLLAKGIVKAKVPGCNRYLISSFFEAIVKRPHTIVVPPIIRQAIRDAKTSKNNHILMYQTSANVKIIKGVLQQLPEEKFYVYGTGQDYTEGNIVFKPFSEEGFIRDFASAKAVVANGGFSFISEAVYLKKPVYSFPIPQQFEQWMNAAYIQKLKFGRHFSELNPDNLKAFLYDLPLFEQKLRAYRQDGNNSLFSELDKTLKAIFSASMK